MNREYIPSSFSSSLQHATVIWVDLWTTAFAIRELIFSAAMSPDAATVKRTSRDVVVTVAGTAFGTLIPTLPRDVKVKQHYQSIVERKV